MAHTLPPLPYAVDALEPVYDKATLEIHHGKHHATYVDRLNQAIAPFPELQAKTAEELLSDLTLIPQGIRQKVINHGGGHSNHSLFWRTIGPKKGGEPSGKVGAAIKTTFGGYDTFRQKFSDSATDVFGSGWTFLVQDSKGDLAIKNFANQDSPISQQLKPLMTLDLWEHAYYLKWQNRRPDWIKAYWDLVDWQAVDALYIEEPAWLAANVE